MDNKEQEKNEYEYAKKWKNIINTTQSNYNNMIKRLSRKQKVSNFVLIYYSIFLIINTLTGKYFPNFFDSSLSEYFGIILSVVMLAYSLINSNANYAVRISNIEAAHNKLKTIKRKLDDKNLKKCIDKYNKITDCTERREDVDFFITVKHLCKEFGINWLTKKHKYLNNKSEEEDLEVPEEYRHQEKVVNNYISEINVFVEEGKILFECIWQIILFVIPIIIFILCIVTSSNGIIEIKSFLSSPPGAFSYSVK